MLKRAKQLLLAASRGAGLFSAVGNTKWRKRRLLILAYHGVSLDDEHLWSPGLYLPQELFARRMKALADFGCNVLPLQEALARLRRRDLPDKAVAITFDDGTYDFFARAYPILKQFGYPATVYQTTYYCTWNCPVFDAICSYILWKGQGKQIDAQDFAGCTGTLDLASAEGRKSALRRIRRFVSSEGMSAADKDHLAARLAKRLGVDFQRILDKRLIHLMNPTELQCLVADGIDLQLHTHRHRTPLDRNLFLKELEDNRRGLKSVGQSCANHFCYPTGYHNEAFLPWLREAGIESAVTCDPGLAAQNTNVLVLPRLVDTCNLSDVEFTGWLCGISDFLPRRATSKGGMARVEEMAEEVATYQEHRRLRA